MTEPREMTQDDWRMLEDIQRRHDEATVLIHEEFASALRAAGWLERPLPHRPVTEWSYRTPTGWHQFLLPDDSTLADYPAAWDRAIQVLKEAAEQR